MRLLQISVGIRPLQMTALHSTHLISNTFLGTSLFDKGCDILLNEWSCACRARFHLLKVEMLRTLKCSAICLTLKDSGISSFDAGQGLPAALLAVRESIVEWYYGSRVYENLIYGASRMQMYGTSIMKVKRENCLINGETGFGIRPWTETWCSILYK